MRFHADTRTAFLIGITGALLGAVVNSGLRRGAKPLMVAALRQGILLQQGARLRWEELHEDLEDLRAEALHGLHGETPEEKAPPVAK